MLEKRIEKQNCEGCKRFTDYEIEYFRSAQAPEGIPREGFCKECGHKMSHR